MKRSFFFPIQPLALGGVLLFGVACAEIPNPTDAVPNYTIINHTGPVVAKAQYDLVINSETAPTEATLRTAATHLWKEVASKPESIRVRFFLAETVSDSTVFATAVVSKYGVRNFDFPTPVTPPQE